MGIGWNMALHQNLLDTPLEPSPKITEGKVPLLDLWTQVPIQETMILEMEPERIITLY